MSETMERDEEKEPPWLTAMIDQRMALMEQELGPAVDGLQSYGVVLTLLTEPPEGSSHAVAERWERSCDRCGLYCPDDAEFYTGHATRELGGAKVMVAFGMCPACRRVR